MKILRKKKEFPFEISSFVAYKLIESTLHYNIFGIKNSLQSFIECLIDSNLSLYNTITNDKIHLYVCNMNIFGVAFNQNAKIKKPVSK